MFDLQNMPATWGFMGAVLCIVAVTQLAKKLARLTKADWDDSLVVHIVPVAIGIALAFVPDVSVDGVESFGARLALFIGVGGFSSWFYRLVKGAFNLALRKLGAKTIPDSDYPASVHAEDTPVDNPSRHL